MLERLVPDQVEQHQERGVGGRRVKDRHLVETEDRMAFLDGEIPLRTATDALAGQETVWNRLVEMRQRGELLAGGKGVGSPFADQGIIRDAFHGRIRDKVIGNPVLQRTYGNGSICLECRKILCWHHS